MMRLERLELCETEDKDEEKPDEKIEEAEEKPEEKVAEKAESTPEAQGEENAMKQFLADVDKGPPHASVVKLEKHTRDLVDGETEFEVRR